MLEAERAHCFSVFHSRSALSRCSRNRRTRAAETGTSALSLRGTITGRLSSSPRPRRRMVAVDGSEYFLVFANGHPGSVANKYQAHRRFAQFHYLDAVVRRCQPSIPNPRAAPSLNRVFLPLAPLRFEIRKSPCRTAPARPGLLRGRIAVFGSRFCQQLCHPAIMSKLSPLQRE